MERALTADITGHHVNPTKSASRGSEHPEQMVPALFEHVGGGGGGGRAGHGLA